MLHTQEYKDKSATYLLKQLSSNETLSAIYPVLSKFAQVALTMAVSNADAERGFSCMNRVKTELQKRMSASSLDTLLRISLEGPEKKFDLNVAVAKWSQVRKHQII